MRKKKEISGIILIVIMTLLLVGCTADFDAEGYTKAVLDVSYKNQTEQYVELTESTEKDAEQIFEQNLDAMVEEFGGLMLSEELMENYRGLFADMMKQVKYEVGEAIKDEEQNYTVNVTICPMRIFDDTYAVFQQEAEAYAREISDGALNGNAVPTEEEMQNHVFELYYQILKNALEDEVQYGDPETVTVHVNRDEDNIYSIPKEDIAALDEKTISMEILGQSTETAE